MGRANNFKNRKQRHDPLMKDLDTAQGTLKKINKKKQAQAANGDAEEDEEFVDARASRKILQLAKEQQDEIAEEEDAEREQANQNDARFKHISYNDSEEEDDDEEIAGEDISDFEPEGEFVGEEEEVVEIDDEDAAMFEQYFKRSEDFNSMGGSYNLADKIMASIREKETELAHNDFDMDDDEDVEERHEHKQRPMDGVELPEKVIRAYTTVGSILTTWTHGKLPKLFKVIPSLKNWQDVLYVTNPEVWSPHIVYEATKLFVSNLSAKES